MNIDLIIFIIGATIIIYFGMLLLCHPRFSGCRYEITDNSVDIFHYKIPVHRIPYQNILSAEIVHGRHILSWFAYFNFTGWLPSRCWGQAIEIEFKGRRGVKAVIITPDDAAAFMEEINKHLSNIPHEATSDIERSK